MASGNANVKLRPVKFAFLVPYNDKASLLQAIQINSFLWGGVYNPIIPVYKSVPRNFPQHLKEHIRDKDYFQKYLEIFSPDFIVRLGDCANQDFDKDKSENISVSDIFIGFETWRVPHYGIGLFEVLNHFASHEYKYLQRNPKKLCVPKFSGKYSLFLSSIFGQLSDEINEIFAKGYSSFFECTYPECSINTYTELLDQQNLFLRRLTAYQINQLGSNPCLFYLDANKFIDIVDYWNLRALGFDVLPIAKQAINSDSLRKYVVNFIEQNYKPNKYPPTSNTATFYESSSINTFDFEAENFLKSLGVPFRCPIRKNEIDENKVHLSYLPLIGDGAFEMYIKTSIKYPFVRDARFNFTNNTGQLKLISPEFMFPTIRRAAFANDIELTTYQDETLMAEVIPEGNNLVAISIGGVDFPEWRVTKGKFTYLSHFSDWTLQLKLPFAEEVFFRWFQNTDFDISISQAGRIAKQMLKSLGGIRGIWLLAEKGIFDLIYKRFRYKTIRITEKAETKTTETEREINESKVIEFKNLQDKLKEISNKSTSYQHRNTDKLLKKLLDSEVLQLVLKVNCTFCNQPSWYSLDELKYEVKCIKCWQPFKIPAYSPNNKLRWAYRTIGTFSPATEHYGSYAVLLALRFFSVSLRGKITPIFGLSVKLKNSKVSQGETPDADLALFFGDDFSNGNPDLVFVECKTYNNRFVEKDIKYMRFLAENFPNAYFVFATLESELTVGEKGVIKKFVEDLKQPRKKEAKVVILTGNELYSEKSPPNCWEEKTELDLDSLHIKFMNNKLAALAEISQKIYLS